ncbi:hypothetical protein PISMIDRAFT_679677 [Pisolithus microcarpus 441]|uniref:Uncharacterized protein n=1 Tax=Pisolithus microcarpus 441 TaxID=765257 RepID=A0A0C9ZKY4_9AGAM|nr:hypothetical protein PISMIDRAFT_679677 [Pisolithus microcarpus 441]
MWNNNSKNGYMTKIEKHNEICMTGSYTVQSHEGRSSKASTLVENLTDLRGVVGRVASLPDEVNVLARSLDATVDDVR